MRTLFVILAALLLPAAASSDELQWTNVGPVRAVRNNRDNEIRFVANPTAACGGRFELFEVDPPMGAAGDIYQGRILGLLTSAMANGWDVMIVADGCDDTEMGKAITVDEVLIVKK